MGRVSATTGAPKAMLQTAALFALDASERGVRRVRHVAGSMTNRLQLQLHVWRLAVDPDTRRWIEETRHSLSSGGAEQEEVTRDELLKLMEERRRRIT